MVNKTLSLILFSFFSLSAALGRVDSLKFSHPAHFKGAGTDCSVCHAATADDKPIAKNSLGHSDLSACAPCHEKEVTEKVCTFCHTHPETHPKTKQVRNLHFFHSYHVEDNASCLKCHPGFEEKETWQLKRTIPEMKDCLVCHNNKKAAKECATCHPDTKILHPASHNKARFEQTGHARLARQDEHECAACHQTRECLACHRGQTPVKIHLPGHRYTHGREAQKQNKNCTYCHPQTYCRQCH